MRIVLFFGLLITCSSSVLGQSTPKPPFPDCNKLVQLTQACSTGFKSIRGQRKAIKYSEVYHAKFNLPLTTQPSIQVFGKGTMFSAQVARTGNYTQACKAYRDFVAWMEECIPEWIFVTEPEEKDQLFLFKAYQDESMDRGITLSVEMVKLHGVYIVRFNMQQ